MKERSITISDIGRSIGVSAQVVGKVLNGGKGTASCSESTRRKILDTAARLGYRPNHAARAMRKGRAGNLGVVSDMTFGMKGLFRELQTGLQLATDEAGTGLSLIGLMRQEDDTYREPRIFREHAVDGLLLNLLAYSQGARYVERHLARLGVPAIWINEKLDADACHPDDYGASRTVTETLIRRGRKRIAYLCYNFHNSSHHYSMYDRRDGYLDAMDEAGLEPRPILLAAEAAFDIRLARQLSDELNRAERPDAIVCYGEEPQLLAAAVFPQMGVSCADEIRLGSFDSNTLNQYIPRISALLPWSELGRTAVDMLLTRIEHPAKALPARRIPFEITNVGEP